jgi:hypothetical protein
VPVRRKYILHEQRAQGVRQAFEKSVESVGELVVKMMQPPHLVVAALALACFKGSCN